MANKKTGKASGRKGKNVKYRLSMKIITLVVVGVCAILSFKTYQVNQEIDQYAAVREDLKNQIENEEVNQENIKEELSYINSDEYIEEQAREKLGLVFDNEIIFKKKNR